MTWDMVNRHDKILAVRGMDLSPFADSLVATTSKCHRNGVYIVRGRVGRSKSLNQPECNKGCCIVMEEVVIKCGLGLILGECREYMRPVG